jgi:iron(III) transport system ATP-binding protein
MNGIETSPLLDVSELTKKFGAVDVLSGVSFTLSPGECVALVGPSGCGKTTTLRCIGGLDFADSGSIVLSGRLLSDGPHGVVPQKRDMGMVFQSYSVWPHLTIFENVAYGLRLKGMAPGEIKRRVDSIMEMMAIGHLATRRSHQLSGGQLQRVALARTLVAEPKLVLFDEPLSNLDAQLRLHMRVEIRSLLKRLGMSAVYVTHDQSEASVVADRTAIMHEGKIKQLGTWKDLYFAPGSRFVAEFIGGGNIIDGIVTESGGADIRVGFSGSDKSVTVRREKAPLQGRQGDKVSVYVPREAVKLGAKGRGLCDARVTQVIAGPAVFELALESEIGDLMALSLATDAMPAVADECSIDFDQSHVSIFGA